MNTMDSNAQIIPAQGLIKLNTIGENSSGVTIPHHFNTVKYGFKFFILFLLLIQIYHFISKLPN
jgi:hypothetical protein